MRQKRIGRKKIKRILKLRVIVLKIGLTEPWTYGSLNKVVLTMPKTVGARKSVSVSPTEERRVSCILMPLVFGRLFL